MIVSIATMITVFTMLVDCLGCSGNRVPFVLRKIVFGLLARITLVDVYSGVRDQKQQLSIANKMMKKSSGNAAGTNEVGRNVSPDDVTALRRDVARREWRAMSIILDRIFLLIFLALLVYVSLTLAYPSVIPIPSEGFSGVTFFDNKDVQDTENMTENGYDGTENGLDGA